MNALDRLVENRLVENGGQYITAFRLYPALGEALMGDLYRLSDLPTFQRIWAELDAAADDMRALAAGVNFSDASANDLTEFITADASVQLQIEYFLTDSLSFELRRSLFLRAVTVHDAGVLDLLLGEAATDLASRFLPPTFVSLFPPLPKPVRTAALSIAAEELSKRAFVEARRRAQSHIGGHAADLLAFQAVQPERFAGRIKDALATMTRITLSASRGRALMGTVREIAGSDGIEIDELLNAEIYQAAVEVAGGRDLVDLTVHPEALNIFPELAVNRIVDQFRKRKTDKRVAEVVDVGLDNNLDLLPAEKASAETKLSFTRLVAAIRDLPERDQRIFQIQAERCPANEIATALGMKPAAVRQVTARLRRRLRSVG